MKEISKKAKINILNILRVLILYFFTFFLNFILPKDKSRICFSSRQGTTYGSNSKELYEYFKKDKNFKCYYLLSSKKKAASLSAQNKDPNLIFTYSLKGIFQVLRSRVLIVTHGVDDYLGIFINPLSQVMINFHHGFPNRRNLFLSNKTSSLKLFKAKQIDGKFMRALFASSDLIKYLFISRRQIDSRKVFITGFPKTDRLFRYALKHKRKTTKENINVLYAPTWRDDSFTKLLPLKDFNKIKLVSFLRNNKIKLFLRFHPNNYENSKAQLKEYIDDKYIFDLNSHKLENIEEFLPKTDIFITDFSSLAYDFLILDRPMIFINTGSEDYKEFTPLDYELCYPGFEVKDFKELLNAISQSIKKPELFSLERRFVRKLFFNYLDDKSCYRAKKLIQKLVKTES